MIRKTTQLLMFVALAGGCKKCGEPHCVEPEVKPIFCDNDQDGYWGQIFGDSSTCDVFYTGEKDCFVAPDALLDCEDGLGDNDPTVNPAAEEIACNEIDENCDGHLDPGVIEVYGLDGDGDGFPLEGFEQVLCHGTGAPKVVPEGWVLYAQPFDCNDEDPAIYPGAEEVCNGYDDDCDTFIDEDLDEPHYLDLDGDGYGDMYEPPIDICPELSPPDYYPGIPHTDCKDSVPAINPGAVEICNTIDDDCDTLIDEGLLETHYYDQDGDRYGDIRTPAKDFCPGYADTHYVVGIPHTDCADSNWSDYPASDYPDTSLVNPGMTDIPCNDLDEDCDGLDECGGSFDYEGDIHVFTTSAVASSSENIGLATTVLHGLTITKSGTSTPYLSNPATFVVSAPGQDMTGANEGAVHVLTFNYDNPPSAIDLDGYTSVKDYTHLVISGPVSQHQLGVSLATGDIDGDGIDDLVLSAPNASRPSSSVSNGAVYVFRGTTLNALLSSASAQADWAANDPHEVTVEDADMVIFGGKTDRAIGGMLEVLDLNGDGSDDIVISCPDKTTLEKAKVFFAYGDPTGMSFAPNATKAEVVWLSTWTYGTSGVGMDLDDVDDFLESKGDLGTVLDSTGSFFSSSTPTLLLTQPSTKIGANGNVGIAVAMEASTLSTTNDPYQADEWFSGEVGSTTGQESKQYFGEGAANIGDINGDGRDDIAIGAPGFHGNRGRVYIYLGGTTSTSGDALEETWIIEGTTSGERLGQRVFGLGDLNNDGYDDFVLGFPDASTTDKFGSLYNLAGAVVVLYGGSEWTTTGGTLNLSGITRKQSAEIYEAKASLGDRVIHTELDSDPYPDFLISAPGADGSAGNRGPGAVYVHLSSR